MQPCGFTQWRTYTQRCDTRRSTSIRLTRCVIDDSTQRHIHSPETPQHAARACCNPRAVPRRLGCIQLRVVPEDAIGVEGHTSFGCQIRRNTRSLGYTLLQRHQPW